MFSARGDYFVCMKQNKLVRSHQHLMGTHLGTPLACSFCTAIVNQVWEWIITWLALKKVQRIFWSLFSITFIKKLCQFFICTCPRSTTRQQRVSVLFQLCPKWAYECVIVTMKISSHADTVSVHIHTFLRICQSSSSLEAASFPLT